MTEEDKIKRLEAEIEQLKTDKIALLDTLENLHALKNGPPLLSQLQEWKETVAEAERLINKHREENKA